MLAMLCTLKCRLSSTLNCYCKHMVEKCCYLYCRSYTSVLISVGFCKRKRRRKKSSGPSATGTA